MRHACLPLLLLAATACSRSHAPSPAAGAPPPGTDASIAQTVPAGIGPAPAASLAGAAPVAVDATGKTEPEVAASAPKSDPRWQDVDPNTLGGRDEDELAKFQAEQRRRDAELMKRDAEEANARVGDGRDQAQDRYAGDASSDERYDEGRYDPRDDASRYDPRDDERDYDNGPYGGMPEDAPYDEGDYGDEPPYDDEYPPPDEDYDPRYDPDYDPRYDRR